ncbi:DUF3152 domain-containing protein [Nocardioides sp.]|uniref:DUF3152 domain-containing protein n=1 Tax=Nocardioides sp. TaxID=35761 RepID=UPI002C3F9C90|nr:DUF3152 domain-containing protein [Nocardioides sp.]HXH80214.1 DUF3152 domain-containing protein [Nocardioides sp.]
MLTRLAFVLLALLLGATVLGGRSPAVADLPPLTNVEAPAISGTPKEGQVLRAHPGRWTPQRAETRYRWLRDAEPIKGARGRTYRLTALDVATRVSVEVRVRAEGYAWTSAVSEPTTEVDYRTPVRRQVTYSVATRGRVTTSLAAFKRQAQETYADARGWRAGGIAFRQVPRGGDFTLVLAEASTLPSFGAECSTFWSCRVGRFVVINQDRWKFASPAWNRARAGLRNYRHLVVNHETGHWLGHGHRGCPGAGQLAPVMMQQSKGLDGCRFNPWPRPAEW